MTDQPLHDDLQRFWNELVKDGLADPDRFDPQLAALIREQKWTSTDVSPTPAHTAKLREDLMNLSIGPGTIPFGEFTGVAPSVNGRFQPSRSRDRNAIGLGDRRRSRWDSWGIAQVCATALLLITLGLGYLVFQPFGRGPDTRTSIPAAFVVATASPAPAEDPAFQVTIPAEMVPSGEGVVHSIVAYTVSPNKYTSVWTPYCCAGPVLEYVVEGSMSFRAAAAIQVVRASGTVEEVPADTEVVLGPGDGLLTRIETAMEARNIGDDTAVVLDWIAIGANDEFGGRSYTGWLEHGVGFQVWPTPVSGPVTLRLQPVMLTAGEEVSIPPGELKLVVAVGDGVYILRPSTGIETSFDVLRISDGSPLGYILTLEPLNPVSTSPVAASPTP